ncbi:unnamed protein product [Camellia sinensis]
MDLRFYIHKLSCEVIVNGAPYWLLSTASNHCLCFTWFDVQNEAFVMLPGLDFSGFYNGTSVDWKLMDWKDYAAVIVCCRGNPCVDVWMLEDRCGGESNWCRKFVIGPVIGVERFWLLQCTKNGEIIAEDAWGRIFLYSPQSGETKYIPINGVQLKAFHYVESLVSIKGFKQQKLNNQQCPFSKGFGIGSFDNVEIVLALEEEFELEIPNKETDKIDSCFLAIE